MVRALAVPLRIVTILLAAAVGVYAGDIFEQFWPEADVYINTGHDTRLMFLGSGTRTQEVGRSDGQLGVYMDFFLAPLLKERETRHTQIAPDKFLMFRVGYLYNKTVATSTKPSVVENWAVIDLTSRFYLSYKILLSDRNRGDLGFTNGEFEPRYRNRLRLERTWRIAKRSLTPYAHAEVFYDWRYDGFTRQRYAAGNVFEFNKRVALDGYYLRQEDSKAKVKGMNVFGLTLEVYLR
jgi:hypothetical protein